MKGPDCKTVEIEEPEPGHKIFSIEVALNSLTGQMDMEFNRLGKKVNIPGFRKGKAPRSILEAKYKDAVRSEALERIVSDAAWKSLREADVVPFFDPEIGDLKAPDGEPIRFRVTVDEWPVVELSNYRDLKLSRRVKPVGDDDIDRELTGLQNHNLDFIPVKRESMKGDKIKLSYQRFMEDGRAFGKRVTDVEMILDAPPGSDVVPLTLTEGLIGAEVDDQKSIVIDFPEDHPARSLAGSKVEFRIDVHEILEKALPVVDDSFAARVMGKEDGTLDSLKDEIRAELTRMAEEEADRELQAHLFDELLKHNKVDLSSRIIDRVSQSSMPDFIPEDQIPEDKREEAAKQRASITEERRKGSTRAIQKLAIVTEISKKEDLEPSDREIDRAVQAILARKDLSHLSRDERKEEEESARSEMRRAIREDKVFRWVKEHSNLSEG